MNVLVILFSERDSFTHRKQGAQPTKPFSIHCLLKDVIDYFNLKKRKNLRKIFVYNKHK